MQNNKVGKTLKTGLGWAVGLLIGNAVFVPLVSHRTVLDGCMIGLIAAFLMLVIYILIAIAQSRTDARR